MSQEKKRRRKSKARLQHCPSCQCLPEDMKNSSRKEEDTDVEAFIDKYECAIQNYPIRPIIRKSHSSPLDYGNDFPTNVNHCLRRRHSAKHPSRTRKEDVIEDIMMNLLICSELPSNHSDEDDCYCDCKIPSKGFEISDVQSDYPCNHQGRTVLKNESTNVNDCSRKLHKHHTHSKTESKGKKDHSRWKQDLEHFCPACTNSGGLNFENVEIEQFKRKSRVSPRTKEVKEDWIRGKTVMDADGSKNEDLGKVENDNEDTDCGAVVDDKNPKKTTINICAAGDMNLYLTKSQILELIDRALNEKFGVIPEELKDNNAREELEEHEVKLLKQMKNLRREQINQIQDDFRKLCTLQQTYLDIMSPRLSLPTFPSRTNMVEEQTKNLREDEEMQKLASIV